MGPGAGVDDRSREQGDWTTGRGPGRQMARRDRQEVAGWQAGGSGSGDRIWRGESGLIT